MTSDPKKTPARCLGKAAWLLLAVYIIGIATGVGGGLFVIQYKVRQVLRGSAETRGPIDLVFAKVEFDVAHEAQLTPAERTVLHERMEALARDFKQTRVRVAGELRDSIWREVGTVTANVDPSRREALRASIQKRVDRWGLPPDQPAPAPGK